MSYWNERDARREGGQDFERRGFYDRERYYGLDDEDRAYRRGYEEAREQREYEERQAEERAAREREQRDERIREAQREYDEARAEEEEQEAEPEPEPPEPLVEAAEQARSEFFNSQAEMWP